MTDGAGVLITIGGLVLKVDGSPVDAGSDIVEVT